MAGEYLDSDLLNDFRNGERKAFEEIYERYYSMLYVFSFKLTSNQEEAKDIVIEALNILFMKHKDFASIPNIRAFIYITARNRCWDYLKYMQRLTERNKRYLDTLRQDEEILNDQIDGELLRAIYKSIETLPRQCRNVIEMIYVQELKYREISELLGISVKTVENLRKYALDKMRKYLSQKRLLAGLYLLLFTFI